LANFGFDLEYDEKFAKQKFLVKKRRGPRNFVHNIKNEERPNPFPFTLTNFLEKTFLAAFSMDSRSASYFLFLHEYLIFVKREL
jgi:hypothetical protein